MFLIFLIEQMCVLAFYFAYANAILVDGTNSPRLIIYFILLACFSLSYVLRNSKKYSKLKYFPLIGLAFVFIFARTAVGIVAAVIPCIYIIYLVKKDRYHTDYYSFRSLVFKLMIGIAFLFAIVSLGNRLELFYKLSFQYAIMFIISSLYSLRTIRHSDEIIKNRRFLIINLLIITVTCSICILLSTEAVLGSVIYGIKLIYVKIIVPIVIQILYIIFSPLGRFLDKAIKLIDPDFLYELPQGEEADEKNMAAAEADSTVFYVVTISLIVFTALAYIIIKGFSNRKKSGSEKGISENRSFLDDEDKKKAINMPFNKTNRVRQWYRKFLMLCRKKSMDIYIFDNSQTIYDKSSDMFKNHAEDLNSMKEIYRKARYGEEAVSSQDIKTVKDIYKTLEKEK